MKDAYTNEILAYAISTSMEEDFVLDTVNMCMELHKHEIPQNALVHSDQGIHYKAYSFKALYFATCLATAPGIPAVEIIINKL